MRETEHRTSSQTGEIRAIPNGMAEVIKFGEGEVDRYTIDSGWHSSSDAQPTARAASRKAINMRYQLSRELAIPMDDAASFLAGPGEFTSSASEHDI
jgi:hypothetical protein